MEIITKYVAEDGVEFIGKKECIDHEDNVRAVLEEVDKCRNNPSEALIALMDGVQDKLGIDLVSYNGYVELFRNHTPCAHCCSLWRILADYSKDYPTIFNKYGELIEDYISLYGEK